MKVNNTLATGTITINVNGESFSADLDANGTAVVNITCDTWNVNNYSFEVSYSGDANFTAADASGYFFGNRGICHATP